MIDFSKWDKGQIYEYVQRLHYEVKSFPEMTSLCFRNREMFYGEREIITLHQDNIEWSPGFVFWYEKDPLDKGRLFTKEEFAAVVQKFLRQKLTKDITLDCRNFAWILRRGRKHIKHPALDEIIKDVVSGKFPESIILDFLEDCGL